MIVDANAPPCVHQHGRRGHHRRPRRRGDENDEVNAEGREDDDADFDLGYDELRALVARADPMRAADVSIGDDDDVYTRDDDTLFDDDADQIEKLEEALAVRGRALAAAHVALAARDARINLLEAEQITLSSKGAVAAAAVAAPTTTSVDEKTAALVARAREAAEADAAVLRREFQEQERAHLAVVHNLEARCHAAEEAAAMVTAAATAAASSISAPAATGSTPGSGGAVVLQPPPPPGATDGCDDKGPIVLKDDPTFGKV